MYQFSSRKLTLQVLMMIHTVLSSCCEGTSITLSPLGMVSVCSGGKVQLTCEKISGSFLYWTVSVPHLTILRKSTVGKQGHILSPKHKIGYTEFNITRISQSPALTSQMLINNVTTWMNGSTIYCSENRNSENNAPMVVINIDDVLRSIDSLKVSLVNHFFTNDVTVTLQWPQEDGAVYHIDVLPQISHTDLTKTISHNTKTINLTISYNIQYNVTIVSSLCGVTTTKVLNYADCGVPLSLVNRNVKLNYNSTLDGSVLILTCENEMSNTNNTDEQTLNVTCHSNGNWIPDPAEFTCLSTTAPPVTVATVDVKNGSSASAGVILGSVLGGSMFVAIAVIIAISTFLCLKKKGLLHPKMVNRLPDIQLENTYHPYVESSTEQPDQQDTLVYADIGPTSLKKRAKHNIVTLSPDDTDDRVEYALLNHSLQKPVVETNLDSVADDSLNLDTLLIQIRGVVTSHWYQLGEVLGVDKDVLDKCTNYTPEESIIEILDRWLRKFPGRPTWRDVASALRKINLQQLANDIEMIYETGKLPIQVDDDDDDQQMFITTALELSLSEEEKTRTTDFNNCHDWNESAPPLPPKPLAASGSDISKEMSAPPRPPKCVAKS